MVGSRIIMRDFTRWQGKLKEADQVFQKRMKRVGDDIGQFAVRQYEFTTRTWNHPVEFTYSLRMLGGILKIDAGTTDQIWQWVDRGTRGPYPIEPTGPWPLRFRSGFTPKTRPGSMVARRGRSFGPMVHAMSVMHPGIKARQFTEGVVELVGPFAIDEMEKDISLWAADYF